ncbi:MAG TPA: tRNA uridine(34) 5-carboxymethylaminomethyl modification radical SAM/GNAT enzyme Elp3 [Candidatus Poseidoniia archaeon]|jgi:elongator complex protein 3|nr:tRNA uridine(34) 5-carboxymethylaminomethyl modification radical SAM/GNAT enzyme Elp3 [Candidatus Poseidoniia archaeon]
MMEAKLVVNRLLEKKPKTRQEVQLIKLEVAKEEKFDMVPPNNQLLAQIDASKEPELAKLLRVKPMRTSAGVTPIAIMTSPAACPHGTCTYCPGGPTNDSPQSYTGHEPAARRGKRHNYNSKSQVNARLEQYVRNGHPTDKIEIIIMGGTFTDRSPDYQNEFLTGAFETLNGKKLPLDEALHLNGGAKHKCVALTMETRPTECNSWNVFNMRKQGATRVEIGVQCLDDEVHDKVNRQQKVVDVIQATRLLKEAGLKVVYHMMPGLPGMTPETDLRDFKRLFEEEDFQPDMLKLYPTLLVKGSPLARNPGDFVPYDTETAANLVADLKEIVPPYVRIQRIQRDIPKPQIIAGVMNSNLRQYARRELKDRGKKCKCINCRELWRAKIDPSTAELKEIEYKASGGNEYFMSYESGSKLLAYLRLRLDQNATVRELKVTGQSANIGKKSTGVQHMGLGSKLMKIAEEKVKDYQKIRVTHGPGTRLYYEKLGYNLEENYMVKTLT